MSCFSFVYYKIRNCGPQQNCVITDFVHLKGFIRRPIVATLAGEWGLRLHFTTFLSLCIRKRREMFYLCNGVIWARWGMRRGGGTLGPKRYTCHAWYLSPGCTGHIFDGSDFTVADGIMLRSGTCVVSQECPRVATFAGTLTISSLEHFICNCMDRATENRNIKPKPKPKS